MSDTPAEFVTGTSNPADFTVDQVVTHLGTADSTEFDRVQTLEADGKGRKGITDLTLPEAQEAAQPADPDAPQVGDTYDGADGYTRKIISV